jgi:hypothetical protein
MLMYLLGERGFTDGRGEFERIFYLL